MVKQQRWLSKVNFILIGIFCEDGCLDTFLTRVHRTSLLTALSILTGIWSGLVRLSVCLSGLQDALAGCKNKILQLQTLCKLQVDPSPITEGARTQEKPTNECCPSINKAFSWQLAAPDGSMAISHSIGIHRTQSRSGLYKAGVKRRKVFYFESYKNDLVRPRQLQRGGCGAFSAVRKKLVFMGVKFFISLLMDRSFCCLVLQLATEGSGGFFFPGSTRLLIHVF